VLAYANKNELPFKVALDVAAMSPGVWRHPARTHQLSHR
jgi:hypothetical protein